MVEEVFLAYGVPTVPATKLVLHQEPEYVADSPVDEKDKRDVGVVNDLEETPHEQMFNHYSQTVHLITLSTRIWLRVFGAGCGLPSTP